MRRSSGKKRADEIPKRERNEFEVAKIQAGSQNGSKLEFARAVLIQNDSPKRWAALFGTSPEFVRSIIRGDRSVPKKYFQKIGERILEISLEKNAQTQEAFKILDLKFGPNVDPNRF